MNITIGETVYVDNENRTVSSISQNIHGNPIILWHSKKNSEGVCIPAVWEEWREGKPSKRRSLS